MFELFIRQAIKANVLSYVYKALPWSNICT